MANPHVAATNTLLQGLAVTVLVAVATALAQVIGAGGHFSWQTVGYTVVTSALTAVASYAQHALIVPTLAARKAVAQDGQAPGPN